MQKKEEKKKLVHTDNSNWKALRFFFSHMSKKSRCIIQIGCLASCHFWTKKNPVVIVRIRVRVRVKFRVRVRVGVKIGVRLELGYV
jgi:hypothetical protein